MAETNDIALLHEYIDRNSETAFAELVNRHVNLVYSVALRYVGNSHDAQDVTQAVFVILAKKAASLRQRTNLTGWLYETARFTSSQLLRTRARQQAREQEAYMQSTLNDSETEILWRQLAPLLEDAMSRLNERDRTLVALRFFENRNVAETAAALGIQEWAVRKRVERTIEKLQKIFFKRGVTSTTDAITGAISANSVQVAPAMLAKAVTATAIAKGATASTSTLTLIKGALKIMAWTKTKTTIVVGAVALATVGTTSVAFNVFFFKPSAEDVFKHFSNDRYLQKAPPVVILRPTQYANQGEWINGTDTRFLGRNRSMEWVIAAAYNVGPERMILPPDLPIGGFDYLLTVSGNPRTVLQEAIKKQFGLIAHTETRMTNVLVLKVSRPRAQGLTINRSTINNNSILANDGDLKLTHFTMSDMADALAGYYLSTPVIDETGLGGSYDLEMRWDARLNGNDRADAINQIMQNQLGLELVPEQRSIEMLVVEYQDGPSDYTPRAGSDLQGYWKGLEQMGGDHLWPVLLKITEPTDGQFRALWRRPWLNSQFVPASAVTYNPPKIKIGVAALPGVFEGEINSAHTEIKGTWTYKDQPPHSVTLTLTDLKTESEQLEARNAKKSFYQTSAADPAGHWKIPNSSDFSLDIARLPDGKLSCSMVRPGWDGDIDATLIQYTPPVMHIEWAWRGLGTFDGKIENGKLVGTWLQSRRGTPQPIIFERE